MEPMKIKTLIKNLPPITVKGSKETAITGISSDSATVSPGNLFIAKGAGVRSIPQALSAGAAAILTDIYDPFLDLPQLIYPNIGEVEAKLAARYYGRPAEELFVVGVTGTKGKTTVAHLIQHLLEGLGTPSGLIGTIERVIGDNRRPSTLTTHDVVSNQRWLKEMVQKGCKAAVIEVSSHGLAQGRVDEIGFDLGIFTNLHSDHLDYHGTMEEYAAAKRRLFERAERSILNADSPWAERMGKGITFGIDKGDVRAEEIEFRGSETRFKVDGHPFTSPLIGRFNVYNALAAIAVGLEKGATLERLAEILSQFEAVPARLERIGNAFIDFAHTGEALENVLQTLKEIAKGRVIVVFGCGGNRDPQRRIGMGRAANQWADVSIITNDNPRKEDPEEIARQIVAVFEKKPWVELDRRRAIEMALRMAGKDDIVLIAGKGHEKVQIFADRTIPFDDIAIVKEILHAIE